MRHALGLATLFVLFACGSSEGGTESSSSGGSSGSTSGSSSGGAPGSSGGSSGDTSCADCGRCGIAGVNSKDFAAVEEVGTSADGNAVVGLFHEKKGACTSEDRLRFLLTFAEGAATLAARPAGTTITKSTATFASQKYTWNDRDLAMTYDSEGSTLTFTFTSSGVAKDVVCTSDSATVTCE